MTKSENWLRYFHKMTAPRIITKRLLTLGEAASYLGISARQLEYLTAEEEVRQTRLPNTRRRLYDVMDLDEFVERSKIKMT